MSIQLTVSSAYGRDYKSKASALADWLANKDFIIRSVGPYMGQYINIESVRESGEHAVISIRYKADTKVTVWRFG